MSLFDKFLRPFTVLLFLNIHEKGSSASGSASKQSVKSATTSSSTSDSATLVSQTTTTPSITVSPPLTTTTPASIPTSTATPTTNTVTTTISMSQLPVTTPWLPTGNIPYLPSPTESDPRVGWVYKLSKSELQREMIKFDLDSEGTVVQLRSSFIKFLRCGRPHEDSSSATSLYMAENKQFLGENEFASTEKNNPNSVTTSTYVYNRQIPSSNIHSANNAEESRIKEMLNLPPSASFREVQERIESLTRQSSINRVIPSSTSYGLDSLPLESSVPKSVSFVNNTLPREMSMQPIDSMYAHPADQYYYNNSLSSGKVTRSQYFEVPSSHGIPLESHRVQESRENAYLLRQYDTFSSNLPSYSQPHPTTTNPRGRLSLPSHFEVASSNLGEGISQTTPIAHTYLPSRGNRVDIVDMCNLVRKWNLKFDGDNHPVTFIERLNELTEAYNINSDLLLKALPELFKGEALLWYRNTKGLWETYDDFLKYFVEQYFPPDYYRNLDEEIIRRTQGLGEPIRKYIVALTTLIRRRGKFSVHETLNRLYANMRPEYKLTVRRDHFQSISELVRLAEGYESYLREQKTYRPPPNPAQSLVPETAYENRNRSAKNFHVEMVETHNPQENLFRNENQPNHQRTSSFRQQPKGNQLSSRPINPTQAIRNQTPTTTASGNVLNQRPRNPPTCWNCGNKGHVYRDCRKPKVLRCFNCQKEGVRTVECTCKSENSTRGRNQRGVPSPELNTPPRTAGASGSN